jgi:cytochrome c biogenesis protein CcdA
MHKKPLQIFGFIMSFTYIFVGLLFILTTFAEEFISEPAYRKIFGGILVVYGMLRVTFFVRKLIKKT